MADEDWRVEVELADSDAAEKLHRVAGAKELYSHARRELRNRAALTHDDNLVFAYATTRADADAAEQTLRELAGAEQLEAKFSLMRWHPLAARWEDPAAPFPSDPASVAEEREEGEQSEVAREAQEGHATGIPEYEVRITLPSHSEAVALAKQLAGEGIPSQRHWHHLLIGAWTEDDANALAERLRHEVAAGSDIRVEATLAYVLRQDPDAGGPPLSPFVLF
jgi:hypothetical protein